MKILSEEIINIGGKDYTLFLNRKSILAWEKFAGEENSKMGQIESSYNNLFNGKNAEIKKGINPFEDITEPNTEENDIYDVEVSVLIDSYMSNPYSFFNVSQIGLGESFEVPVTTLFNENILELLQPK